MRLAGTGDGNRSTDRHRRLTQITSYRKIGSVVLTGNRANCRARSPAEQIYVHFSTGAGELSDGK